MSTNAAGLNAKDLLCPNENCKCLILKASKAKFLNIETDHVPIVIDHHKPMS